MYQWPPIESILQKGGERKLHLVGSDESGNVDALSEVLAKHGHHFYAINLRVMNLNALRDVIHTFLQCDTTGTLTELSIQSGGDFCKYDEHSGIKYQDYLLSPTHSREPAFQNMLRALKVLRVSMVNLQWDTIAFSTQLVSLWVDRVTLGYDDAAMLFLRALSSACVLRDLQITDLITFRLPGITIDQGALPSVRFPSLKSLFLGGLTFNTLRTLLLMITPGPHRLKLYFGPECLTIAVEQSGHVQLPERVPLASLCSLLKPIPVDTLTLVDHIQCTTVWLKGAMLRTLLNALPTLKTLRLQNWILYRRTWRDIARQPHDTQTDPQTDSLPSLKGLYITSGKFGNTRLKDVRKVVTGHNLQKLVLGDTGETLGSNRKHRKPIQECRDLMGWLKENVRDFRLAEREYHLPESELYQWRLW
ncbi:unnamed protein product [Rhizoctonia solani]|uniref:Uncharacterized protein n=1 Tax=Rhizoctonia solani TaxID=456999 RepID=A0A8H3AZ55_9AGAM|nr:unnamed protein product [Rhizoctonia solani]